MAQTIKLKRSATQNAVPSTSSLALGEIALNTYDGKLFIKKDVGGTESIVTIGAVGAGSIGPTELASTAVTAGSYGSTSAIPVITIDADGRITSASTATISGLSANSVTSTEIAANAVGISELDVTDGTNGQVLTTDGSGTLTFEDQSGGAASANAFATNVASGNGSTATFTLSSTPSAESKIIAFINGVFQNQDAYTISGTDITFDTAPISGTNNVVIYVIGDVYSGESVLISNFDGNGSTTAFTLSNNPGNENNTQVYIDGVYQQKTTYSVSGTTLTFSTAPPTGTANIEVVMLTSTTVNTPAAGSVVTASMADDSVTGAKIVSSAVTTAKIADVNVTTAKIADANITTAKIANDAVTLDKIADAVFVIESEGISSNDNDTTLPTSAAVKDYVDGKDFETGLAGDSGTGTVNTSQTLTVSGTTNEVNTSVSGQTVTVGLPDSVSLTSNLTVGGYIAGPSSFTIDPAGVGDNTGTVVIAGNLQVDGTQTIINSTSMSVDDLNLTLASGAANAAAANGAGLTIDGASATLLYASSGDKFVFNKTVDATIGTAAQPNITSLGTLTGLTVSSTTATLNINGSNTGASLINFGDAADGNVGRIYYDHSADFMQFKAADGERLRINSTGIDVTGTVTATDLLIDTDVIVTDSTNDRVGINKTSPATTLDVGGSIYFSSILRGTSDGSASSPTIQPGNDGDTGLYRPTTNTIGFSTGGTERMRIEADGDVAFAANATGGALIKGVSGNQADRDNGGYPQFTFVGNEGTGMRRVSSNVLALDSSGAERMRIDSSGNLLVGKTAADNTTVGIRLLGSSGFGSFVRDGNTPVVLNRLTSDGEILRFDKDSTTVGSMGSEGGDALYIQSGTTSGSGLHFHPTSGLIRPARNGVTVDAVLNLGQDVRRFKDSHFSGQVNASTLTATNTANATGLSLRSGTETLSGEGWATALYNYNSNDGTLFLNRDTNADPHPVFHIGGWNNPSYHPNFSYSAGDAGMVTLTKPAGGTKAEGSSYAYRGLSDGGEYSNWIKDASGTWFFDSDNKHQFYGDVDVRQSLAVNSDKLGNEYLFLWQSVGGDGGVLFGDATGGSRLNWQIVPSTSSRDLLFYSYGMPGHSVKFGSAGGIKSLADGGTSSAFFLAGDSAAAANGKVAMGLRDGMIQFRDPLDYYHKMWYYDGINVSTNSGHGHFRVWGDSDNSVMNNSSAENTIRFSIDTVTGNIGTSDGATNIYNASDERLKENVTALPSMLGKINALRPISFDWKYKEGETGIYGFVAQEVQDVDESLVFNSGTTGYRNDKTYGEDLELDGNIEDTLAINERKLFPMLVKAVQEQQTIINDLKSRLDEAGL